jgi:hypothetical protein
MTRNAPSPAFGRNQRTSLKPPAAKRQPPLLKRPNSGVARPDPVRPRLDAVGSISGTTNEPATTSFAPMLGCVARRLLPMALYWHFPSKDKLIAAVAARIWRNANRLGSRRRLRVRGITMDRVALGAIPAPCCNRDLTCPT